ncbi:DMT family protein [Neisseria sp. Ec49-e6-T10]|uniref:DMT family protein n=1 Tax=Neisseria sp. Ec49-e6-T10 TaxID=3140744 RepID=UPI003EB75551
MHSLLITIGLLTLSNIFMTFAWYGHLKYAHSKVWVVAALISWGIALFEYLLQVPANRIGYQVASAGQLKVIQEVISLTVFIPFSMYILKEPFRSDYIWAGLCLIGAVFFMFRSKIM